MKKFLFIMVGLFLSLNLANANDLLFKASNGVLSENSHGVKKLSDEELRQVRGGWFGFQRAAEFDFYNVRYSSFAYVVFDTTVSGSATTSARSSAAKRLGFDPKYYGNNIVVVGKIRWMNGKKQYFMQAGTNRNDLSNVWNYGVMTPIYNSFRQRY